MARGIQPYNPVVLVLLYVEPRATVSAFESVRSFPRSDRGNAVKAEPPAKNMSRTLLQRGLRKDRTRRDSQSADNCSHQAPRDAFEP